MRRFASILCALLAFSACAFAQGAQKQTLPNGLTVLVLENHTAPVVAVRFYVKTGSIYEGQYAGAGISHLFEHVLQEGSKTRTKEQINNESQAIGGQTNAYTTDDVTAYHIVTASRYFDRALNNLSDSLMNATFPEAEVKTQQGIIHHEMAMDDDDPSRVVWDTWQSTAFLVHPVRFPTIGYRESFDKLTRDDILNYYKSHYTPENTILAVCGDVKAQDVFASAAKTLGSWERRSASTPAIPDEPQQTTPRRAVVEMPVQTANFLMGWHTIPLQHPDLYALDCLAGVLGQGDSSRLVQEIRERQQLVYGISAFSQTPNYNAGTFVISGSLPPEKLKGLEGAIWQQINRIKNTGVTAAELKRTQRIIETNYVFDTDVANQAERMAYDYMGTGNPDYSSQYVTRINTVTPAQVQAAAKKYLLPTGTTIAIVQPISKAQGTTTASTSTASKALPAQMHTLKNGLRVVIREDHSNPTVAIAAMGWGGVRYEDPKKAGIATITAQMLSRGTTKRNAAAFSELIDSLGGTFQTSSGYNSWTLTSNWLRRDWRTGLSLAQETLLSPAFAPAELSHVKTLILAGIKEQNDDPDSAASQLMRRLYYRNHPYGRSTLGTPETIQGISRADVVKFWGDTFDPKRTVMAIYGDINAAETLRVMEYTFGSIKGHPAPAPSVPAFVPLEKRVEGETIKPDTQQTVLYFAYPGIDVKNEDRYALSVLDGALSGIYYPGGRLHARLRDIQLVYGVHAFSSPGIDTGTFVVVAATTRDKRDEVKGIIEEEIARIRNADISPEELERAKGMCITSHAVDLQASTGQASDVIADELYGLGYKDSDVYETNINAVTLADVRRVAQKYLLAEKSAYAVAEPEK